MTPEQQRFDKLIKLCAYYNHALNIEGTDLLDPRVEAAQEFFLKVPIDKLDLLYQKVIGRTNEKTACFFPMRHEIAEIYNIIADMPTGNQKRIGCDPELTEDKVYEKFMKENNISINCPDEKLTDEQFYKDYANMPFYAMLKRYGFMRCYKLISKIEISDEEWEKRRRHRLAEIAHEDRTSRHQFSKKEDNEIKNPDYFQDI